MDSYFDLGIYSRPITTSSAEAQLWFDRGLNWSYSFHHVEAIRCYEKVVELDPDCAMGYWGLAYGVGPYYNMPWPKYSPAGLISALADAYNYSREAQKRAGNASPVEKALIDALVCRFPVEKDADPDDFPSWDDAYADAMRTVYAQFPDDPDVSALTAEALMCRTPWLLWDLEKGLPADGADTAEAIEIVEKGLAHCEATGAGHHPGLIHFYIHIMEMSPEPEKALAASDILRTLVPDAGHMVHMPSHIYVLCGQYQKALDTNVEAVVADDKYIETDPALGIYTIYRLHNIHFQIYAAIFLGKYEEAVRAADLIWETVTPDALRVEHEFLVNYLEGYYGMKVHVLIRFGKWQEIIDAPMPAEPELFLVTTALWHYAKGVAYSATGDVDNAAEQQALFKDAWLRIPEGRIIFNNDCKEVLKVGEAMLAGELEYRRENYEVAYGHLRDSVALYDRLNYTEPWAWMQPPRHALGALLLEQGHVAEAAAVYRADLGLDDSLVRPSQHLDNIWSLHGYAECCRGLGLDEEAAVIEQKLAMAQAVADVPIESSCFCRTVDDCCD